MIQKQLYSLYNAPITQFDITKFNKEHILIKYFNNIL